MNFIKRWLIKRQIRKAHEEIEELIEKFPKTKQRGWYYNRLQYSFWLGNYDFVKYNHERNEKYMFWLGKNA